MPYTTTQLVNESFYLSSVVSEEFETVSGYQLNEGIDLLNKLISFKAVDDRLIPFFTTYNFDATSSPSTEKYNIPGLIEVETLTFVWQTIRYPMQLLSRSEYFATGRANNISTLPSCYFIEKRLGGCDLYMYPLPNIDYTFEIHGKFRLVPVVQGENLLLKYDTFYIEYLRYALADYICQEYQIDNPAQNKMRLKEYESKLYDNSPIDFTMKKSSILQNSCGGPDIYYQANILKGWFPPR